MLKVLGACVALMVAAICVNVPYSWNSSIWPQQTTQIETTNERRPAANHVDLMSVHVAWQSMHDKRYANFTLTSTLGTSGGGDKSYGWLSVGLSNKRQMANADIFVCQASPTNGPFVQRFSSTANYELEPASTNALGLSNMAVESSATNLTCRFTLDLAINPQSIDLAKVRILVAYGFGTSHDMIEIVAHKDTFAFILFSLYICIGTLAYHGSRRASTKQVFSLIS